MAERSIIVAACRTPIGRLLGNLSSISATDLGAVCAREAIRRAGVEPSAVDEVIIGNVLSAGLGQAPARQVALKAGLPPSVAAVTINKVCGSGLKAVMFADQSIRAGDTQVVLAGGMESMSQAPHLLPSSRTGVKFGDQRLVDSMIHDGLWCAFQRWHMGSAAEHTAKQYGITRADQDAYAVDSHRRAMNAMESRCFEAEIAVVSRAGGSSESVREDEGPRRDSSFEKLSALKPAFDPAGTVTAGNSSTISDGAAAVVVVAESNPMARRAPPLARIIATATAGVDPKDVFIAPVPAIRLVLNKAGLDAPDIDIWEINEAFAAQMLACINELDLDRARVNIHGGAIALGHPIGASGARILVTLLHALERHRKRFGLAAACLGGGNAVAVIVERIG